MDAAGTVTRIHQEDTCQALGIDSEDNQRRAKYEASGGPSLAAVARLLDAWAIDPAAALEQLLEQVVFTVGIGNADAHGKNVALLHPEPTGIELAPLYDTVPTMLWPKLRSAAAMTVNGKADLRTIDLDDIAAEAGSWSLDPIRARATAGEVADRLLSALAHVDVDTPALALIGARLRRLLART